MRPVDAFHIGPQKAGTTWIYQCLSEHPEVGCPPRNAIHFFDMHYHLGREWYAAQFRGQESKKVLLDPTNSYLRSPVAPRRIARENPKAKIIVCLRNPVERAFSHYWHEKKKRRYDFAFSEILENYDLYACWLEPGFYAVHIERYLEYFPREQILCQLFDDLESDPPAFLRQLLDFIEVDRDFGPSVLEERVNVARPPSTKAERAALATLNVTGLKPLAAKSKGLRRLRGLLAESNTDMERQSDVPRDLQRQLDDACRADIERLEAMLQVDLQRWRRHDKP